MLTISINGFGRIGRNAFKIALTKKNMRVVAINDLGGIDNLAYLLKYDSVYGRYDKSVKVEGQNLIVGGKKYLVYRIANPAELPWKKLKVDVVLEYTGIFTKKEDVEKHLAAGAKKVVISAPTDSADIKTAVIGVNDSEIKGEKIIATASCTTNCCAPIIAVLEKVFGVEKALLSTVHAATASQRTVDLVDKKDWRRGRSSVNNIIPSTTGAAKATALVLPSIAKKFDGVSLRVPVICGSISDIVVLLKKNVTVNDVNNALRQAAKTPGLKGILEVSDDELVSTDILGTTASAIVDSNYTRVVGGPETKLGTGNLVKVLA
ncbi:MAG: glyceraldehyde 3-phosphate dehydrogenase NAD-binding domain-containing protein, partial [Parcubacteria group bacterium]